jgi:hypothetical protein
MISKWQKPPHIGERQLEKGWKTSAVKGSAGGVSCCATLERRKGHAEKAAMMKYVMCAHVLRQSGKLNNRQN